MSTPTGSGPLDPLSTPLAVALTSALLDPIIAGAKASSLAELQGIPGVRVPPAFVITTRAFDDFLAASPGLQLLIAQLEQQADPEEVRRLAPAAQQAMLATPIPRALRTALTAAYRAFSASLGEPAALVSVRSSATNEDLAGASFAGQYVSVLDVRGPGALVAAVRRVWASAYAADALVYTRRQRPGAPPVKMAVIVQQMVPATAAGTVFSVDLETGAPLISISATWGLGARESAVKPRSDSAPRRRPTASSGRRAPFLRARSLTSSSASGTGCPACVHSGAPGAPQSRAAQGIKNSHAPFVDAKRQSERLDDRHVMAGAICVRSVTRRHEGSKPSLGDRAVGSIETRLGADRTYARIGDATLRSGEQPGDLARVSGMLLELPDPEQVRQGNPRRP